MASYKNMSKDSVAWKNIKKEHDKKIKKETGKDNKVEKNFITLKYSSSKS